MFWLVLTAVLLPVVLVLLVLLRDRYMPWMTRHRSSMWFFFGAAELGFAALRAARGVSGWERWLGVVWTGLLGVYFIGMSFWFRRMDAGGNPAR